MFDARKIAISTVKCIMQWRENARMPLALLTIIVLSALCGGMYCACLWDTGQRLCAFEPFIALLHNYRLAIVVMSTLLLINMDAPFFSANDALHIFRLGRFNWALGRIIYCLLVGFFIPFFLAGVVTLLLSPFTFFYNEWSPAAVALSQNMDAFRISGISYYFPPVISWDIIISMKPVAAILWTCTLLGLINASLTIIMMALSMSYNRLIGVGMCIALILSGPFLQVFGKWSIYTNGMLSLHRLTDNTLTTTYPSLIHSIIYTSWCF